MIKTGQALQDTIDSVNENLGSKADKTTTVAGIALSGDITAESLLSKLFKWKTAVNPIQNGGNFVTQGEYDLGEWH